jgi:hypothetical protein
MGPKTALSRLSLVMDTNLDYTENFYLRWAHTEMIRSDSVKKSVPTVLRHLRGIFGSTFENKSLLYSTLCTSCIDFDRRKSSPHRSEIYFHFLSRFHTSLRDAIAKNAISECHLFAVFLQLVDEDASTYPTHFRGFLSILESLLERRSSGHINFRLSYLYYFLLNSLLFTSSVGDVFVWGDTALVSDAYTLLEKIEVPEAVFDDTILRYLPGRFWHLSINQRLLTWDYVFCSLQDLPGLLRFEFKLLQNTASWIDFGRNSMNFSVYAETCLLEIFAIPKVRQFLECVTSPISRRN